MLYFYMQLKINKMNNFYTSESSINPLYSNYLKKNNGLNFNGVVKNKTPEEVEREKRIGFLKLEMLYYKNNFYKSLIPLSKVILPIKSPLEIKKMKRKYKALVIRMTNKQDLSVLKGYEKRGFNGYHIDHMVSIYDGFRFGIPAEIISNINNLRAIPKYNNELKGSRSNIDLLNNMINLIVLAHILDAYAIYTNSILSVKCFKGF